MIAKKFRSSRPVILGLLIALIIAGLAGYRLSGALDCTSFESYDLVKDECYYECDTDAECEAISNKIDAELNAEYKDSTSKVPTGSETKGTTYSISRDGNLSPSPNTEHAKLWELSKQIIGPDATTKLASFEVFNDENNTTAASVWRSDNDPNKWHMNINEAYKDDRKDLIHTIVHEYAHVLTLSGTQVPEVNGSCPRFELSEGCASQGSYIQAFHSKFWSKFGDQIPKDDGGNQDDVTSFYNDKQDQFVTDYAATNPTEDMAESFAYFVLRPKPSSSQIKDQKVNFYYQYDELVALRNKMRVAISKT